MRIATWGRIGLLAAATTLAACGGGGGGGGGGTVSLKTQDDVIREIDNAALLQLIADPDAFVPESTGSEPMGYQALRDRTNMPKRAGSKSYAPRATEPCPAGGTYTVDGLSGDFVYSLFAQTLASDYAVEQYDDCTFTTDFSDTVLNGAIQAGATTGTSGTAESPSYQAAVFGSGSTPFRDVTEYTTGERFTTRILGRFENRLVGSIQETRQVVGIDLIASFEGESFRFGFDLGQSGDPFVLSEEIEQNLVEIDGPIGYSSEFCDDGVVHYTTLEALHYNVEAGYFDLGQLVIESGSQSVLVTFNNDGSVSYQFANGDSGSIPPEMLGSGGGCMAV